MIALLVWRAKKEVTRPTGKDSVELELGVDILREKKISINRLERVDTFEE